MGYKKIVNMYKDTGVLMFREVYAMEKIHGTSAHIKYHEGEITFFSGGGKHETFVALFDLEKLAEAFKAIGHDEVTIYGESYGGKQQGMSDTYGKEARFVAFEVKVHDCWLNVPNAHDVVTKLDLEFVHYEKGPAELDWLNEQRDAPSVQAKRNGIEEDKLREGVVVRPLMEMWKSNGERVMCKHKHDKFRETKTPREVDPEKMKVLEDARAVAEEWVVDMRLQHVMDKMEKVGEMEHTPLVIKAMIADVKAESEGEVVWSKDVEKAIGRATAQLYKKTVSKIPV